MFCFEIFETIFNVTETKKFGSPLRFAYQILNPIRLQLVLLINQKLIGLLYTRTAEPKIHLFEYFQKNSENLPKKYQITNIQH